MGTFMTVNGGGYIGDKPPKNINDRGVLNTELLLYPPQTEDEPEDKDVSQDGMYLLQEEADRQELLLSTELNANIDRKPDPNQEEILLPTSLG